MKVLRFLLILILIFFGILVILVSGLCVSSKIKITKSSMSSPDGKFQAIWHGNENYTNAYIINNFTKQKSKSLWEYKEASLFGFGEDLPTFMDEGGVHVERYEVFWKREKICVFKIHISHNWSGEKEVYILRCNAETLACRPE